jgi:hypothetical protein
MERTAARLEEPAPMNKSSIPGHSSWVGMKARCLRATSPGWRLYGGRGIKVCARWRDSFEAFIEDMGPRPPGMSINRVDNDGDYEPGNCRWATRVQQMSNTRVNHMVEFRGEKLTLAEVARRTGVHPGRLRYRLSGPSVLTAEEAVAAKRYAPIPTTRG